MLKNLPVVGSVSALGLVLSAPAFSQVVIATTDAIAAIDATETAITAVGTALIVLAAVAMAYRWVKASFF